VLIRVLYNCQHKQAAAAAADTLDLAQHLAHRDHALKTRRACSCYVLRYAVCYRVEFMGMCGLFGAVLSGVQLLILERAELLHTDFTLVRYITLHSY
jgi:Solute carrier family 35